MANKLITAFKENKNDFRKKVIIATGITVAAVAGAIVVSKLKDNSTEVLLVTTDAAEAIAEVASE